MKRLCFGSIATVLKLCKASNVTQKRIVGDLLLSINERYHLSDEGTIAHNYLKGKRNLPSEITDAAITVEIHTVSNYFQLNIIPLIDPSKVKIALLAIKDIIATDDTINADVVIDTANGISKESLLSETTFNLSDFLSGAFIYGVNNSRNRDCETAIGEINSDYIKAFEDEASSITIINSSIASVDISDDIQIDLSKIASDLSASSISNRSLLVTLLSESGGTCYKCGAPLGMPQNNKPTDYCDIVYLHSDDSDQDTYETAVALCKKCSSRFSAATPTEIAQLRGIKERLMKNTTALDEAANIPIETQIADVLHEVALIQNSVDTTELRIVPLKIDEKITDIPLRRKTVAYVTQYFYIVQDVLAQLAQERKLDTTSLASEIKLKYQAVSKVLSEQDEINSTLIDGLYNQIGRKHRSACEIVIAYFVQSCEVFDAIS
jgi:hypothetical protein